MAQSWYTDRPQEQGMERSPSLHINLALLEQKSSPGMTAPVQLATFSTMLKTSRQEATQDIRPNPELAKYTVQNSYSRTLCANDKANCMNIQGFAKPPFDLDRGYGTQIQKENENEFMSLLLECLAHKQLVGESEFVCWRNLLTTVCSTPYEIDGRFDKGTIVAVQKIGHVFYMFAFPTEEAVAAEAAYDERQKHMIYWGCNFESYVTTGMAGAPVNLNNEFCSVVKTKIGSHSVVFRGEVDCCRGDTLIELKTSKEFDHEGHEKSFRRYKLIKWWLQSYLLGVPEIICGFRDDNGIVKRLQRYNVNELPQMMLERRPETCLSFLDTFLQFVKTSVRSDFVPHVFKRNPNSAAFEMTLDLEGKYKFIPSWFADLATSQ